MKKIKNYIFSILSFSLILPSIVFAQDLANPDVVIPDAGVPKGAIVGILQNLMLWLLAVVGVLGVIGFAVSGIMYLTAAGNEEQIQRAKRTFINSIVGVIVAMLGVIVMQAAKALLSGSTSNF